MSCGRRKGKAPAGMRLMQRVNSAPSECAGLVEAALPVLGAMKRDRNDEKLCWRIGSELSDGGCERDAEPAGDPMDAIVLERVNGGAHAAVIGAEGYGAHK